MERLLEDRYEVTAFDNMSEGRLENVAHLKKVKRFMFVKPNLRDAKSTEKVVAGEDVVFHITRRSQADAEQGFLTLPKEVPLVQ